MNTFQISLTDTLIAKEQKQPAFVNQNKNATTNTKISNSTTTKNTNANIGTYRDQNPSGQPSLTLMTTIQIHISNNLNILLILFHLCDPGHS